MAASTDGSGVTAASASSTTSTPAPGFVAPTVRMRRHVRAPGTPWNRPSIWRVMYDRRVPFSSSAAMTGSIASTTACGAGPSSAP